MAARTRRQEQKPDERGEIRSIRGFATPWWSAPAIALFAAALGLAACAPDSPSGPKAEPTVSSGTILAMRPVQPDWGTASGAAVLRGLARTASPAEAGKEIQGPGAAIDFVVRETGGATIAVVQTNDQHLQVGDQVTIIRGDRTRLARPGV